MTSRCCWEYQYCNLCLQYIFLVITCEVPEWSYTNLRRAAYIWWSEWFNNNATTPHQHQHLTSRIRPGPSLRSLESPRPQPILKPCEITPLEDKSVGNKDYDTANDSVRVWTKSRYDKAVEEMLSWETSLDYTIAQKLRQAYEWFELSRIESEVEYLFALSDCFTNLLIIFRWPRYSYNGFTPKMIIQCMPSSLHQSISEAFLTAIHRTTADLSLSVDSTIITTSNESFNEYFGQYDGYEKILNAAIFLNDINGTTQIKLAMKVGFAKSYEDLIQDMRMWLEEADAAVALLIKIEEASVYRDLSCQFSDQEKAELYCQELRVKAQDFNADDQFGPSTYKGFQCVGKISSASLEIWRRNSKTGLATKDQINTVGCYSLLWEAFADC